MVTTYHRYTLPDGYYHHSLESSHQPGNSADIAPTFERGYWPQWPVDDPEARAWGKVEDHRARSLALGFSEELLQDATEYWLPGDTWQTPARTMDMPGPLPEGALLTAPEMTAAEQDAEARAYVLAQLAALDAEYLTPRIMAGLAVGDEYAMEAYRLHEDKAEPWRERLAAIPAAS